METRGTTRLSKAFCSARDRNVPVLRRRDRHSPPGPGEATELVSCLDYGVRCTGWLCPLFTLPTLPPEELVEEAMEAERVRKARDVRTARAILERALREGREQRQAALRRGGPVRPPGHGDAAPDSVPPV